MAIRMVMMVPMRASVPTVQRVIVLMCLYMFNQDDLKPLAKVSRHLRAQGLLNTLGYLGQSNLHVILLSAASLSIVLLVGPDVKSPLLKPGHAFDVIGLGKHVHRLHFHQLIAAVRQLAGVAGQGGWVAGDVDDAMKS
jgi:hypothetical protein